MTNLCLATCMSTPRTVKVPANISVLRQSNFAEAAVLHLHHKTLRLSHQNLPASHPIDLMHTYYHRTEIARSQCRTPDTRTDTSLIT